MASVVSKLPQVGTTIFTVMTQRANETGAINLSQGFPDFDPPSRLKQSVTEQIAAGRNQYAPMAGVLERHMEGREFIVGRRVTAADCVTAHLMDWANENHLIGGFPNLRAYLDRMYARATAPQRIAEAFASIRRAA